MGEKSRELSRLRFSYCPSKFKRTRKRGGGRPAPTLMIPGAPARSLRNNKPILLRRIPLQTQACRRRGSIGGI
ncbi:hypothetical protein TRAPUB_3940 [Trametes pubescens]|uniref:Uncharacterized protein n=1 Tax=Trametes pubescens TaxID=154538 RepID=A0A1M2VCN0_TRAPU|nr:hypothetical protein TRAPUB_3940 [Trametes pubescens]